MKKFTVRIVAAAITIIFIAQSASAATLLVPGGQVVGLQINEGQVTIDGFDSHIGSVAQEAGLKEGDRITQIDGHEIHCPEDIRRALQMSDGDVDIYIVRGTTKQELELELINHVAQLNRSGAASWLE